MQKYKWKIVIALSLTLLAVSVVAATADPGGLDDTLAKAAQRLLISELHLAETEYEMNVLGVQVEKTSARVDVELTTHGPLGTITDTIHVFALHDGKTITAVFREPSPEFYKYAEEVSPTLLPRERLLFWQNLWESEHANGVYAPTSAYKLPFTGGTKKYVYQDSNKHFDFSGGGWIARAARGGQAKNGIGKNGEYYTRVTYADGRYGWYVHLQANSWFHGGNGSVYNVNQGDCIGVTGGTGGVPSHLHFNVSTTSNNCTGCNCSQCKNECDVVDGCTPYWVAISFTEGSIPDGGYTPLSQNSTAPCAGGCCCGTNMAVEQTVGDLASGDLETSMPDTENTAEHGASRVWGRKPVLAYFVLNPDLADLLREGVGLDASQFEAVRKIARRESEQLRALYLSSQTIVRDSSLSLEEKRSRIAASGYNRQVLSIIGESQRSLKETLGTELYDRLVAWIEARWLVEREIHSSVQEPESDRSFTVFATQYAASTNYEVALPDKCLKFANRGWSLSSCPAGEYAYGQNYSVKIVRGGYTVNSVHIWDVGPWNEDDNYWATSDDPQHRRRFTDLPTGKPEAQAAYYEDYNGGRDQFGRLVGNPAGIDLSDGVRQALGLGYLENAWVTVTYLWTGDWVGYCCGCGVSAPVVQDARSDGVRSSQEEHILEIPSTAPSDITLTTDIETSAAPAEMFAPTCETGPDADERPPSQSPVNINPDLSPSASAHYTLVRSAVGVGGGKKSSSSFTMRSTSGQAYQAGRLQGNSYQIIPGFWAEASVGGYTRAVYLPLVLRGR